MELVKLVVDALMRQNAGIEAPTCFLPARHGPIPSTKGGTMDWISGLTNRCTSCLSACYTAPSEPTELTQDKYIEATKFWLPITLMDDVGEQDGRIQMSLELMPAGTAAKLPAGLGRGQPNCNPLVEEPKSRFDFSLRALVGNPFSFIYHLLGGACIQNLIIATCTTWLIAAISYWWPSIVAMIKVYSVASDDGGSDNATNSTL